jgi:DNA-binding beta-propeller fold protein YncE
MAGVRPGQRTSPAPGGSTIGITADALENKSHKDSIFYMGRSFQEKEQSPMYTRDSFGIVVESDNRRISIFDTDTQEVLQQLPIDADVLDVAISSDCTRALVTSFYSRIMYQIDLRARPAQVVGSAASPTLLEDVALTADDQYALSVDGSASDQDIVSYSTRQNAFVSFLPTSAQAVAVSPEGCELVLTAQFFNDSVHRFVLHPDGSLEDSGQSFPAGEGPINLIFSPDGQFAFVAAHNGNSISVLSTLNPDNILLLGSAPSSEGPQSLAVTRDGRHVFALSAANVDIYAFDPVAGNLTLERSFAHGLNITSYYGVDQIALDACETKLFISGQGRVAVFTTYGLPLGNVIGAAGPGGIAICSRHFDHHMQD